MMPAAATVGRRAAVGLDAVIAGPGLGQPAPFTGRRPQSPSQQSNAHSHTFPHMSDKPKGLEP